MKLRFTPLALAEIDGILEELVLRSPQGARNVRNRLRDVAESLKENPYLGQVTDRPPLRRRLLHPYPYILFYRVGQTEIAVIGLRHAARHPSSMPS